MGKTVTPVDVGSAPGDGTGDPARTAFGKVNQIIAAIAKGFFSDVDGEIAALTEKTAVVGGDLVLIEDSESSNEKKKATRDNLVGTAMNSFNLYTGVISDDGVWVHEFGTDVFNGTLTVASNSVTNQHRGVFAFRATSGSVYLAAIASNGIDVTTGILNGTTGSDAAVTMSVATNQRLYIENRSGGLITCSVAVSSPWVTA